MLAFAGCCAGAGGMTALDGWDGANWLAASGDGAGGVRSGSCFAIGAMGVGASTTAGKTVVLGS